MFDIANELIQHWSYDLYSRKPGPALLEDGILTPTDLDLACFMSALVDRQAVINIPKYTSRRPRTERENEMIVSKDNRHGHVMGLRSNKNVFSFSVLINDANVVQSVFETKEDILGAPRNFMLVDLNGQWYEGWNVIEFLPTAKENDFLKNKKLWTENKIYFKNFVHPNRWISFYGKYYLLTKALIQRLEDEAKFLRDEVKQLQNKPSGSTKAHSDSGKPIKVAAFEAEVDIEFKNQYMESTVLSDILGEDLKKVNEIRKSELQVISYQLLPKLRFAARATELAVYNHLMSHNLAVPTIPNTFPFRSLVSNSIWSMSYKKPGKRTIWNRLEMANKFPGFPDFALRYRIYEKTERVADND